MTRSNPPTVGRQVTLEEFADPSRCTAIAEHTGDRCRHPAVPGLEVCHSHAGPEDLAQLADSLSSTEEAT